VDEVMVEKAEGIEVFLGGGAAVEPVLSVVGFGERGWPVTAGKQASAVA
jgi:hypothetical protein